MRERKDTKNDLPVYESRPPSWLPKAHTSADLGYPGFYPPRPRQDEDVLSDTNIKHGFVLGQAVSAEHFSAQATVNDSFRSGDTLLNLEELMNEIFARKTGNIPPVPPSTFKIPSRVTLNDSKRHTYFADLANPAVPLHKLGKNVPHGAKGHDLLDLLQSNNVAIPRAVWFLRVFGANETAGLRNKPTYNPTHYSIEWTNVFTSYMKKQLGEISLPSAPRPGLNIKQTFKGVLADTESRQRWTSRFAFCLQLLRTFYAEGLVDRKTFLTWVVQQMSSCNLAQAGFIARLAEEYLEGMVGSRALTRPFVEACLAKLTEIRSTPAQEIMIDTETLLISIVQRLCLAVPDAFISPRMWMMHAGLLTIVLFDDLREVGANPCTDHERNKLLQSFADIRERNDHMLFRHLPSLVTAKLGTAVSDIELLNSISHDTDMSSIVFFPHCTDTSPGFGDKMDMLLTWAVTPLQFGDHRPFAAVTLIRFWRDRARDRANRRECTPPDEFLQDHLFDWLDSSDVAGESENLRAVAVLYGKLVKHELFSYSHYVQRLIARGEPGLSFSEEIESRHRKFLQWIPLHKSSTDLNSQRKLTLYGPRARSVPEDANERKIRREVRAVLPEMFHMPFEQPPLSTTALLERCPTLVSASRYEQVRTFRQWLLLVLLEKIASRDVDVERQSLVLRCYCVAVELMAQTQCHQSLLDLTLAVLEHTATADLLAAVINTLHRFATIWACMNVMRDIITGLFNAHEVWKSRGVRSRPLLNLLVEFDNGLYLDDAAREKVMTDNSAFSLALNPTTTGKSDPVPQHLPEILLLAGDLTEDAPSILAGGLWIKYRGSPDWGWKVWDNTVASLRQIPLITGDVSQGRACALRYGKFLWHIDQHLLAGLDGHILAWLLGRGKSEISALSADTWDILTVVLLYLSVHGALRTTTIFSGLVYPAWQIGISLSGERSEQYETFLRAANNLFRQLLLLDEGSGDIMPPTDLLDVQCIQTRRQDVYSRSHFPTLVANIPLLVTLENHELIDEGIRGELTSIRQSLCDNVAFRRGVFQYLDAIRDAFEGPAQLTDTDVSKSTVVALRMVLGETEEIEPLSWPDASSLLSPWKISATAVQLQFVLRQLGKTVASKEEAGAALDKLSAKILGSTLSSEEAYFVAKMTKGAGSPIAGKFINAGLKCVADILNELPLGADEATGRAESLARAGEVLRVLIYVAEPLRDEPSPLSLIEPAIQDRFLEVLYAKFQAIESLFPLSEPLQLTQGAILLCRFLQFNLGFRGTWTQKAMDHGKGLANLIFRLILLHSTGDESGLVAYPVLLDTLYFLLDELPIDLKSGPFDPFRQYPDVTESCLPSDLPCEYRRQLLSILPFNSPVAAVSHLASSHINSSGKLVHDAVVINRPWEWIENLGEAPVVDPKEEEREREEKDRLKTKYLVKNTGSLSLDIFGARMTGEGVFSAGIDVDAKTVANVMSFEDGHSSESVFARDWRETRVVELDAIVPSKKDIAHSGLINPSSPIKQNKRTPRGSPVSTPGMARSSTHGSSSKSVRPSPTQSAFHRHSTSTVGDGESNTSGSSKKTTASSKRKAMDDSDDEVVIVDGPSAPKGKRQKASKAPAKTKARKR